MKVYCPYCKKDVKYKIEKKDVKLFRGVEVNTFEEVALCDVCNNELYVVKLEDENNKRIYKLYREKVDIIKPQDIVNLREKYNISQRELTAILGFGKMTINRYERGGLPTKSQSDYIKLLIENESEFIKKTKEAYEKGNITKKTYDRIKSKTLNASEEVNIQEIYRQYINSNLCRKPDIYNGYKTFDLELVENIISYIASKVNNLTITSMNKYLWFIDMLSFNQRGVGITGLTYQKQQFGPTIANFKYDEISKLEDKYERIDFEDEYGNLKRDIKSKKNFDITKLSEKELNIVNAVIKLLKNKSVSDISEMSHREQGWKKTKKMENISYEYAMNLNIVD